MIPKLFFEVLACPKCRGRFVTGSSGESLSCVGCAAEFPITEGIPDFTQRGSHPQEEERRFRDEAAQKQMNQAAQDLLQAAGRHHCLPAMEERARSFRRRFSNQEWLLDIGTGYAWPWRQDLEGASVIAIDLSMGNLLLAKRLLGESRSVLLLCADAARLPLANGAISGVWSTQAFQHFPEPTFRQTQRELDRVLGPEFKMEFHHLHPAALYQGLWKLCGKRLHLRGRSGPFETNRLSLAEWRSRWASFRDGRFQISCGYSELFFHPELGFRPRPYPLRLERLLTSRVPVLAGVIARQGVLRVEADLS